MAAFLASSHVASQHFVSDCSHFTQWVILSRSSSDYTESEKILPLKDVLATK